MIGAGDVCERKGGPPLYLLEGSDLLAVHRRDQEKGRDFARRHNDARYCASLDELLGVEGIVAAYVATPPQVHCEQTIAAARAGKHVLCEKPMAMDTAECRRMITACAEANVSLGVAYYRRCYPSIVRVRELLAEGAIGTVRSMSINNQFPLSHRLDLVHFFFDRIAAVAFADGVVRARTVDDVTVEMKAEWGETGVPEQIEIAGDDGRIDVLDLKVGRLRIRSAAGEREEKPGPLRYTHWGIVANFVAHLNDGAPLACSGEDGLMSTAIMDTVSHVAEDGSWLDIDYENPPPLDADRAARLNLLG